MRDFYQTETFTVFGGAYPTETHSSIPADRKSAEVGPLVAVLFALVIGAMTTSGAVAAIKRVHATGYGFQTGGLIEVSAMPALREMLW
jgi:hypothetical protein